MQLSTRFKYGWLEGGGKRMLFVYENKQTGSWGVTWHFNDATWFRSVEECALHYLERRSFPGQYLPNTWNGYLKYFNDRKQQVLPITMAPLKPLTTGQWADNSLSLEQIKATLKH